MIIKPLDQEYKFITLGVTDVENILYPPEILASEEQLFEAAMMGHACGSVIQHTAFSIEQGNIVNNMYISMLQHLQNSNSQKSKTFFKNLLEGNIVQIGSRYKAIGTECPLYLRIEAGKYLVFLKSGGFDMMSINDDGHKVIYDNKLYSKYFKDFSGKPLGTIYKNSDKKKEILEKPYDGPIYSVNEIMMTDLGKKTQWWMYPLMVGMDDGDYIYFQYNVVVKNEAKTTNLMPNVQEIRIKVTKEEAEQLLRNAMVNIFKFHFDKEKNCLIESK